jgi:hypothetical protein
MKNITGTLKAWLPSHVHLKPEQLHTEVALGALAFSSFCMRKSGWTYVGEATITVDIILEPQELVASKIETLKAQQTQLREEVQKKLNVLEDQIQNLLAITYVAEES